MEQMNLNNLNYVERREKRKPFVKVFLIVNQNLKEKNERIGVRTNLDCFGYCYGDISIEQFFKQVEDWAIKPLIERVKGANRRNKISYWGNLRGVRNGSRDTTIDFKDLEITIGDLAKKKLKFDFEKKFEDILKLQKKPSKSQQEIINRIVYLNEEILTLEVLIGKKDGYGYSSYNKPKDSTIKITLTSIEFNEKLKAIELELRRLGDKISIKDIGDFHYKKIEQEVNYSDWLKANIDELKDNWEDDCDGDENEREYRDFDEFCWAMFERTRKIIEVNWEGIPPQQEQDY